jgi:hypothetical protein
LSIAVYVAILLPVPLMFWASIKVYQDHVSVCGTTFSNVASSEAVFTFMAFCSCYAAICAVLYVRQDGWRISPMPAVCLLLSYCSVFVALISEFMIFFFVAHNIDGKRTFDSFQNVAITAFTVNVVGLCIAAFIDNEEGLQKFYYLDQSAQFITNA